MLGFGDTFEINLGQFNSMKFLKNSILVLKIIFLFLLNVCIHFETALSTCYRLILKLEE